MVELTEELRREIGQHFVFGFHGHEVSPEIETLIRDYYVGNIILMKRNVKSAEQVHTLTQRLQTIAKEAGHSRPLMIGTDQENGLVSAFSLAQSQEAGTQFPGAMAMAATGSPALAEQISEATARELKYVGINWAYSPVADVNSDPRNPVIGVRSFGDDPKQVSEYVRAVCKGLTAGGVAPSPKHFPGHGDTHVDSHLALPTIDKPLSSLSALELIPFEAAISTGTASIMTGHMALPRLTNSDRPASLAREVTHDLLREKMGYSGVVVTDCFEMEAVAAREGGVSRAAADAIVAGADVVMVCHQFERHVGAVEEVCKAVERGEIDVEELRASTERIGRLKEQFAEGWEGEKFEREEWKRLKAANGELSRDAYDKCVAVVREIPFAVDASGPIVVFTPRMESINLAIDDADGVLRTADGLLRNTAGPSYVGFAKGLNADLHVVYGDGEPEVDAEKVKGASLVVFVTRNAERARWELGWLGEVVRLRREVDGDLARVVVVMSCGPYDFLGEDCVLGCVACFEYTAPALERAGRVVLGLGSGVGRVPVEI
ncbi:glycoside hydrolase [Stereum hirsutum FP-91666 SS1]|uniref:Glycoside hydrolase n=1 Tax=Stereum hirsutum (strain FP-91666) TaxID=721885 RepID=R7RXL8_STEHR|nr:glycoside hydrolase [Stereum hirsutum FP-91666 SS1]EIM80079.1 glycoside hydrolase [Stereum hirsutum FP-91666 SS1]